MKIRKFWVKGYRSLRDVSLDGLGDFNVFYGPNGSGKSNVLDAMHAFFCVMPHAVDAAYGPKEERISFREAGRRAAQWIVAEDFNLRGSTDSVELGARIEASADSFGGLVFNNAPVEHVEVQVQLTRVRDGEHNLKLSRLLINAQKPGLPFGDTQIRALLRHLVPSAFAHIGVTRTLGINADRGGSPAGGRAVSTIPDGEVISELFRAKNSRDREIRNRYEQLQAFLSATFHRGRFDVFVDPETSELELRELLPEPNPQGLDVRVSRAGHGVVQLYAIVVAALLSGADLVAMEEPEAHLHAPTLGRELRQVLRSLVDQPQTQIRQLFIATHSNLFDLDPTGYWDVRLEGGETVVERRPLYEMDRHFYEPGPARHALQQLLRYAPLEEVVFRRPDGQPVSAGEMLQMLQEDDQTAVDFLNTLHSAALRVVRVAQKKPGSAE